MIPLLVDVSVGIADGAIEDSVGDVECFNERNVLRSQLSGELLDSLSYLNANPLLEVAAVIER